MIIRGKTAEANVVLKSLLKFCDLFDEVPETLAKAGVNSFLEVPNVDLNMPAIDISDRVSPNQGPRSVDVTAIVLHHTAGRFEGSIETLCDPKNQTSAHLVISREAKVAQLVDFSRRAWHAGNTDWNNCSIGIEIESYKTALGMTEIQEAKLVFWIRYLLQTYSIPVARILTHRIVKDGKTACPGFVFPEEADFMAWRKFHFGE